MTGRSTRARGFAGMDPQRQREIASMGGRAAHRSGHAHEFDSQEAAAAGRKGGLAGRGSRQARLAATGAGAGIAGVDGGAGDAVREPARFAPADDDDR